MSTQPDLRLLSLAGVAQRCAQETDLFFRRQANDPRFCFELFRRAIQDRNQRAWDLVHRQYQLLVTGWVQRHPGYPTCGEEVQYLVNRAFEKMWAALAPERFGRLPDLKSALRYLQMCAHSAVVDQARLWGGEAADLPPEESAAMAAQAAPPVDEQALDRAGRRQFWDAISRRLLNDQERQVTIGSFVLALKPSEIVAEYPGSFGSVDEVYRVKANLLERLRRDPELKQLLGFDA